MPTSLSKKKWSSCANKSNSSFFDVTNYVKGCILNCKSSMDQSSTSFSCPVGHLGFDVGCCRAGSRVYFKDWNWVMHINSSAPKASGAFQLLQNQFKGKERADQQWNERERIMIHHSIFCNHCGWSGVSWKDCLTSHFPIYCQDKLCGWRRLCLNINLLHKLNFRSKSNCLWCKSFGKHMTLCRTV